jgi:drug/metabolite transporter (DMT)-like permease
MNTKTLRADIFLLITAMIWGFAFVAQKSGMDYVGAFTYNGVRFLIGSVSLLPLIFLRSLKKNGRNGPREDAIIKTGDIKTLCLYSLLLGAFLFCAVSLQQIGMIYTSVGNSGFITGMYVIFVPVAGIFLKRKTGVPTWLGAALAFVGLFFVSVFANVDALNANIFFEQLKNIFLAINKGDILIFICSIFWTFHVLFLDRLVKKVDAVCLAAGQFIVCGVLALAAGALNITELTGAAGDAAALGTPLGPELFSSGFSYHNLIDGIVPILFGGIFSAGIAYTLQAVAQQYAPPAHASILMCLESVFAAAGGVIFMSEPVNAAKLAGFALMLGGMLATQWDIVARKR